MPNRGDQLTCLENQHLNFFFYLTHLQTSGKYVTTACTK